jgi:transcriptional regulator of acetoin/glycerol metabolism
MPFEEIDLLFICTAHGETRKFIESHALPDEMKIIDLSMDYRIKSNDHDFIYGLPELNRRNTCKSRYVANPGGFATCIELGLLPLAKEHLLKYNWPGNVRELQHIMEKAVILADSKLLKPDDFNFQPKLEKRAEDINMYNLEEVEKTTIERAVKKANGNLSYAAELLGITRYTLYRKIEKFGL